MTTETLERPRTNRIEPSRQPVETEIEPNFGPSDMHAITVIAGLMIGIFSVALVMYGTITLFTWIGS